MNILYLPPYKIQPIIHQIPRPCQRTEKTVEDETGSDSQKPFEKNFEKGWKGTGNLKGGLRSSNAQRRWKTEKTRYHLNFSEGHQLLMV